jgi:hypothetical protein
LIDDIREIIFQIIDNRINNPDSPERDFIYDYISQMKEVDAKIAEAEAEGKPHKLKKITK